jgi:acyl-CoA synthetase (NDP forming)
VPEPERNLDEAVAVAREAIAAGGGWLDARQIRRLLEAYGIPLVAERSVDGPDQAVEAARELGYPVVLKNAAPGAHKTEEGGVILDLPDEDAVRAAAATLGGPVLVQPFVRGGTELLAGAVQDPVFGPLVAFGPGGVLAELIGDAQFRLAPLTDLDARELVASGKAGRLVAGFRGAPPADAPAVADLLVRLSLLVDEVPEVAELDLNPVLALPEGCLAVDARVRVADPARPRRTKSW